MRKVAVLLVMLAVMLIPTSAFAQKDPFRPLVRPETAPAAPAAPGQPAAPTQPTAPGPTLPTTGVNVQNYVVLAIVLIAFGGSLVGIDKYRSLAPR